MPVRAWYLPSSALNDCALRNDADTPRPDAKQVSQTKTPKACHGIQVSRRIISHNRTCQSSRPSYPQRSKTISGLGIAANPNRRGWPNEPHDACFIASNSASWILARYFLYEVQPRSTRLLPGLHAAKDGARALSIGARGRYTVCLLHVPHSLIGWKTDLTLALAHCTGSSVPGGQ